MYAGINDLKNMLVFLKSWLRNDRLATGRIHGNIDFYRFCYADGTCRESTAADIFVNWALKLKVRGLTDVLAYDLPDSYYGYRVAVYCAFPASAADWTLERNLNENGPGWPQKRYISEYTETILSTDAPAPCIADPAAKLELAVTEYLRLVKHDVKYDRYSADADYFIKPLLAILDALHGKVLFPPYGNWQNDLDLSNARHVRLYHAHMYTHLFLNDITSKNENVPFSLLEVCEDAGKELRLQSNRALMHVLNNL